ncbi:phage integrase N-terminal SAM-like domain-containing protein [Acidithiobacillus sp. AMEEHan]|uniref:phage integrase N-terminal SAM-like domain-containing protein n=1 Tax=Acidithiobacillus sp. AMEEHan TaxID=2994951 RepID=UPI0035B1F7E4
MRARIRALHYSIRTEEAYTDWSRHPKEMGATEIEAFLSYLAVERKVSSSTQNQAKAALLFLYKQVLDIDLPWLDDITSAKLSQHLPTVLTSGEARALLHELSGTMW